MSAHDGSRRNPSGATRVVPLPPRQVLSKSLHLPFHSFAPAAEICRLVPFAQTLFIQVRDFGMSVDGRVNNSVLVNMLLLRRKQSLNVLVWTNAGPAPPWSIRLFPNEPFIVCLVFVGIWNVAAWPVTCWQSPRHLEERDLICWVWCLQSMADQNQEKRAKRGGGTMG